MSWVLLVRTIAERNIQFIDDFDFSGETGGFTKYVLSHKCRSLSFWCVRFGSQTKVDTKNAKRQKDLFVVALSENK